ncbi:MAG: hypothetical protein U5K79_24160 [Cyclobacteriaceae bacterium]|nr:hypothetical protein [Cyclobacteriaceae bacterium]
MNRAKPVKIHGPVFKVYPTGVDDTENLVQAFADAKVAGPGAIVKLAEGEFFFDNIEVTDFRGFFMGSGKNKTLVHSLPGGTK